MSATDLSVYDNDPTLYLVTSLTAGNSHIVSATSRLETILRANKIPFKGVDTATDDRMRNLWGRRARGKRFPGLVREGFLVGDLAQIEEWNEFGELKENLAPIGAAKPVAAPPKPAPIAAAPVSIPTNAKQKTENIPPRNSTESSDSGPTQNLALRQLAQDAAAKGRDLKSSKPKEVEALKTPTSVPLPQSPVLKSPVSPSGTNPEPDKGGSIAERTGDTDAPSNKESSVTSAIQEDTKKAENVNTTLDEEEEEEEDDDDEDDEDDEEEDVKKSTTTPPKEEEASGTKIAEETSSSAKAEPAATTTAASTTSTQPAAEPSKAGESVGHEQDQSQQDPSEQLASTTGMQYARIRNPELRTPLREKQSKQSLSPGWSSTTYAATNSPTSPMPLSPMSDRTDNTQYSPSANDAFLAMDSKAQQQQHDDKPLPELPSKKKKSGCPCM